ncbi:MAG: hypothetical protein MUF24_10380 [Chitinophagaceae bacterium]|nr:hypothetical protein [Chitinophagaceae bacterium]
MDNHQYSTAEILAYLRGHMPPADRHRLEQAALDDELLADALEGFGKMREKYSDEFILNRVEKQVIAETEAKEVAAPVVLLPRRRVPWERFMAAALVVGILAIAVKRFTGSDAAIKKPAEINIATTQAPAKAPPLQDSTMPAQTNIAIATPATAPEKGSLAANNKPMAEKPTGSTSKKISVVKEGVPDQGNLALLEPVKDLDGYAADKPIAPRSMAQPRMASPVMNTPQKGFAASTDTSAYIPKNGWQTLSTALQSISLPAATQLTISIDENGRINAWNITPFAAEREKKQLDKLLKTTEPWMIPNKKSAQFVWVW